MVGNWQLTVDQKVKVVLFYAETKSVIAPERRFRANFGTRRAPSKTDKLQTFIRKNFPAYEG